MGHHGARTLTGRASAALRPPSAQRALTSRRRRHHRPLRGTDTRTSRLPRMPVSHSRVRDQGVGPHQQMWRRKPSSSGNRIAREAAEPNWLDEDFVEHAHDIFAGRRQDHGPSHTRSSRTAPTRAARGLLGWSSRHPVLATTTAAFTVWVIALALAAFSGHPVHPPRRATASTTNPALATVVGSPAAATPLKQRPLPSPGQRVRSRTAARTRGLSQRQTVKATAAVQAPVARNAEAVLPRKAASAPPERAVDTGQSEQTGGPFSP